MHKETDQTQIKIQQLDNIAKKIQSLDTSPLYEYRIENGYQPVIGEGDPDAAVMFIGEAPGAQEAQTGRPFVGRAGQYLDALLNTIGIDRQQVYITNIVKDRPPGNRNPRVNEIKLYAPFLTEQINIIQPKVIATLGRFAMEFILKEYHLPQYDKKIGNLHGKALVIRADFGSVNFFPLYHPAAVFYNKKLETVLKNDFTALKKLFL